MKPLQFLLFAMAMALASCSDKKQAQKFPMEMYSVEDLATKIKIVDTICINATHRAENDIKKGRLVLNSSYLSLNRGYSASYGGFKYEDYLKDELDKSHILLDTSVIMYSDIRGAYDDLFKIDCYEERMKDEVLKIHGANFIDSLQRKAIKQFVIDNPNACLL